MSIRTLSVLFCLFIYCLVSIQGSANGPLWTCDEDVLEDENECIFVRTDD